MGQTVSVRKIFSYLNDSWPSGNLEGDLQVEIQGHHKAILSENT